MVLGELKTCGLKSIIFFKNYFQRIETIFLRQIMPKADASSGAFLLLNDSPMENPTDETK